MACLLITAAAGQVEKAVRSFSTLTDDRLALSDWLRDAGCTHVALESTRTSWRPIHNRLEGQFEVLVANAYPSQQVPGRKPDVKDAAWLADRLRHGLLRGSFSPPAEQRRLRDLTRYRTPLVEERARLTNRLQAARADANVKLSSVVTDSRGVSARAIRAALIGGETDPAVLAALARGRLGAKRDLLAQAVVGRFTAHHACLVTAHRSHLDYLEEALERGSAAIEERRRDEQEAIRLLESGPGISQRTAEISGAEIGPDLRRFPSA